MIRSTLALVALSAALVAGGAAASSAASAPTVPVYFLRGERLAPAKRPGSTPADALHALLAGPTRAELRQSFRTYIPPGTAVHGLDVANGLATVDLSAGFVAGRDPRSLLARLSQLVRTLTGLGGTTRAQLLIGGAKISGVFPHIPTEAPITFALLRTPDIPVPKPPLRRLGAPDPRAASHGCVRQSFAVARMTFDFADVGMPVRVLRG